MKKQADTKSTKPKQADTKSTKPTEIETLRAELTSVRKSMKTGMIIVMAGWFVLLMMVGILMSNSVDKSQINSMVKGWSETNKQVNELAEKVTAHDKTFQNVGLWAQQFSDAVINEMYAHRVAIENITGQPIIVTDIVGQARNSTIAQN